MPSRLPSMLAATLLAIATVAGGPVPAASAAPVFFSDTPVGALFYTEVMWLADKGVTTGYSDGTFRPKNAVNRDAMAAFMYRYAGSPAWTAPAQSPFRDMTPSTQFYREVTWLASRKITQGYDDGTFRPTTPVSREAMAAFMYRFAGKPVWSAPAVSPFSDMTPTSPFYAEVTWLANRKITEGYADHTFRPKDPVSREAMAAFMYRFAGRPPYTPPLSYYWTGTGDRTITVSPMTGPLVATVKGWGEPYDFAFVSFIDSSGGTIQSLWVEPGMNGTHLANASADGAKQVARIIVEGTGSWSVQLFPMSGATRWDGTTVVNSWARVYNVGALTTRSVPMTLTSGGYPGLPETGNIIVRTVSAAGALGTTLVNSVGAGTYSFTVPAGTRFLSLDVDGTWTVRRS